VPTNVHFLCCRITKEVRYHDEDSDKDLDHTAGQKHAKDKQKNKKKKQSVPTGKGPRERERDRQRARERKRSTTNLPRSRRAANNGRKVTKRETPRATEQRHRGGGRSGDGKLSRRPVNKESGFSANHAVSRARKPSSPERSRRQSPAKSHRDVRRLDKENTRRRRYTQEYEEQENTDGRRGREHDHDQEQQRGRQRSEGQRRIRGTSRNTDKRRDRTR
jgi:hypothetical protein